jgi:hypothetical protein
MVKKILISISSILIVLIFLFFIFLHLKNKNSFYTSSSSIEAEQHKSLVKKIENYSVEYIDKDIVKEIWIEKYHRKKNLFSSKFVYDSVYSLQIKVDKSKVDVYTFDHTAYRYFSNDSLNSRNYIPRNQNGFFILFNNNTLLNSIDSIIIRSDKSCLEIKIPLK